MAGAVVLTGYPRAADTTDMAVREVAGQAAQPGRRTAEGEVNATAPPNPRSAATRRPGRGRRVVVAAIAVVAVLDLGLVGLLAGSNEMRTRTQLRAARADLARTRTELSATRGGLARSHAELSQTQRQLDRMAGELRQTQAQLSEAQAALSNAAQAPAFGGSGTPSSGGANGNPGGSDAAPGDGGGGQGSANGGGRGGGDGLQQLLDGAGFGWLLGK